MALREGPFSFTDLLHATTGMGTSWRIGPDGVRYTCFACEATFEQSDEGHRALREHESTHGRGTVVDLAELDGRTLRIVTWAAESKRFAGHVTPEIWGVDDERKVVYCLSNAYQRDTVWKWRFTAGRCGALAALSDGMRGGQD